MGNKVVLSICIPTYNRRDNVKNLTLNLLGSKRNDFEIVVVDNASTDNTYTELLKIKDERLKVYLNKKGITAIENGNRALKLASGKYCMLFNDREIANNKYLDEILDFLSKDEYSFVHILPKSIGNRKVKIYGKGLKAKENMRYTGFHPTGLTYNKKYLEKIDLNNYTKYEKVNFFPNFFIVYDIVKYGKMGIYPSKFWELPSDEFKLNQKSGYVDLSKPIYFLPLGIRDRLYKFSEHIFLDKEITEKEKKLLLLRAFSQLYYHASCLYVYYNSQNKYECAHYGIEPKILNFIDYLKISRKFKKDYIEYLKNRNYKIDLEIKLGIFKATIKSLLGVVKQKIKRVVKALIKILRGK